MKYLLLIFFAQILCPILGFSYSRGLQYSSGFKSTGKQAEEINSIFNKILLGKLKIINGAKMLTLNTTGFIDKRVENYSFTITINTESLIMTENITVQKIPYTIIYTSPVPLLFSFDTLYSSIFKLVDPYWLWLPATVFNNTNGTVMKTFTGIANQFGNVFLRIWIRPAVPSNHASHVIVYNLTFAELHAGLSNTENKTVKKFLEQLYHDSFKNISAVLGLQLRVLRKVYKIEFVFQIIISFLLILTTFTMGCDINIQLFLVYIKKPIGPIIGMFCQFFIMPLLAFTLIRLIPIQDEFALGLLTVGCSPGGGPSNIWSTMLGGNLELSMMMTFISTVSSLATMPFSLFCFSFHFNNFNQINIPYKDIFLQLIMLVLPVLCGVSLTYFYPRLGTFFARCTNSIGFIFLSVLLIFNVYVNITIYKMLLNCPILLFIGFLLPSCGFFLGGVIAWVVDQPLPDIFTIALETGIQNISIAVLILLFTMSHPEGDLAAVMVLIVAVFTLIPLYVWAVGHSIVNKKCIFLNNSKQNKISITNIDSIQTEISNELFAKNVITKTNSINSDLSKTNLQ